MMEKYGVMHELRCKCGAVIIVPDTSANNSTPCEVLDPGTDITKNAEHVHKFEEVLDAEPKG